MTVSIEWHTGPQAGSISINSSGITVTKIGRASGIEGAGDAYLKEVLDDAAMPDYGDQHPTINTIYLSDINIAPDDCGKARIQLTYTTPDYTSAPINDTGPGLIEVGATISEVDTEKDINGDQITVAHDFSSTDSDRGVESQGGVVRTFMPQMRLRQSRKESVNPQSKANTYVGRVNSFGIWGYPAESLLCVGITGTSDDNGNSYNVTYEFQYNPDGWGATAVFIDPETGRPPAGLATSGVNAGVVTVDVLQQINFSGLILSF